MGCVALGVSPFNTHCLRHPLQPHFDVIWTGEDFEFLMNTSSPYLI
jgi:hypothetical protein